ncbi:MAG: N-acetylglucosamine-6-phosphate deacetylase [Clostridia bacterium]|nr:N-acetylglucosamine-6-phosphate deacetylase [Clostridia bacterium]
MKGFKNAQVLVEGKGFIKTDLGFENGKIAKIGAEVSEEIISLPENAIVVPGFIDEHIHGAFGADAMDGSVKALSDIANAVASEGTTGFLATTMTQSPENIKNALTAVKDYIASNPKSGAEVIGVHLEGPFISPKHIGAQPLEYVATPSAEVMKKYVEYSGNSVKIVSLAPEVEGAEELIKYLKSKGIVASIAHTGAKYKDCENAVKWGMTNVTHTYNAQTGLHHRDVGVVGSALLFDELSTELICDLIHVSAPAIKLVVKNKNEDKVILITDSMRAKHLPDGESELGGQLVIVKNGEARLVDGTLAGSVLKMNVAVKNVHQTIGVPLETAIEFATANPAKNLGIYDSVGSIKEGKRANVTVLDKNTFDVLLTVKDGEIIYKK